MMQYIQELALSEKYVKRIRDNFDQIYDQDTYSDTYLLLNDAFSIYIHNYGDIFNNMELVFRTRKDKNNMYVEDIKDIGEYEVEFIKDKCIKKDLSYQSNQIRYINTLYDLNDGHILHINEILNYPAEEKLFYGSIKVDTKKEALDYSIWPYFNQEWPDKNPKPFEISEYFSTYGTGVLIPRRGDY